MQPCYWCMVLCLQEPLYGLTNAFSSSRLLSTSRCPLADQTQFS